jgi:hypothetical protein
MNVGRYLRGEDRHVGTARTTQPQPPQRTEPLIGCVNHDCAKCKERTEQEPVGCVADINILQRQMFLDLGYSLSDSLYAHPPQPQRKPLTYEQITTISKKVAESGAKDSIDRFVRAIEAAHGIKEKT